MAENEQQWTISALQNWCSSYLKEKGFENARLTTDLLLAHVLHYERIQLYAHFDKPLSKEELGIFRALFQRRLAHEPVQYIIGEAGFMGFTFFVDQRVLVPRPETELLVEKVVEVMKASAKPELRVLDIGTGSGNIAISIAHYVPSCTVDAIDVSEDALAVAEKNVQRHNISSRVNLIKADVLNLPDFIRSRQYDFIVSNPPYISDQEYALLDKDVKDYEPRIALNECGDGLTFYKTISRLGKTMLADDGWAFVEIAYNQAYPVKEIFSQAEYSTIILIPDMNQITRIVQASRGTA